MYVHKQIQILLKIHKDVLTFDSSNLINFYILKLDNNIMTVLTFYVKKNYNNNAVAHAVAYAITYKY